MTQARRIGVLLTHPVQYYSPWLKVLAGECDLTVYYACEQTAEGQGQAGFGAPVDWDIDLLSGYRWQWLKNVSRRPGVGTFGGCDTPEIAGIIRREKFDAFVMFGWNRKSFLQAAWGARTSGTPLLVRLDSHLMTPRSLLTRIVKKPLYSLILPWLGHYLSPGRRTDEYLRNYAVPASRIHRLAHMIDTGRFGAGAKAARASGQVKSLRAQNGAGRGDFVLLSVGKLIPLKRTELIFEAMALLRERDPALTARVKLWIAGDGPQRAALEALAAEKELPVSFLGFVNQSALPAVYAAADCLVVTSQWETWGLVVNEAFACGLPAIVSDRAGCAPELIEDGVTGWTLRTLDAESLAGLILRAAQYAPGLARTRIAMLSDAASFGPGARRLLHIIDAIKKEA